MIRWRSPLGGNLRLRRAIGIIRDHRGTGLRTQRWDGGVTANGERRGGGRAMPASSAASLLFSILALHVAPDTDRVWSSTLVEALGVFGIRDKTARQAIWRMTADGTVRSERSGR